MREHRGIVSYDPTELVVTARAGTPLAELEATLDEAGQMLPCEPPHFGEGATVGGMIAAGLSGRVARGAVRCAISCSARGSSPAGQAPAFRRRGDEERRRLRPVAPDGRQLRLPRRAHRNLAQVLPKPRLCTSLRLEIDLERALLLLAEWGQQPVPISAASHDGKALYLRTEGGEGSVNAARERIGGEDLDPGYWNELREQRLAFFADPRPLWRLSLPNNTPAVALPGDQLVDWAGAQRWLKSDADAVTIRGIAIEVGGHATCFTAGATSNPFQPLSAPLLRYHRQLKPRWIRRGSSTPAACIPRSDDVCKRI